MHYISGLSQSPDTAELLRTVMHARGLSTDVPPVDETACLYCYLTRPREYRASLERARELEDMFEQEQRAFQR